MNYRRGYTLIELIVAVGLFALVMTLASGAYFVMIGVNRQAQGIATGINNLSFALESMTRSIRTGADYECGSSHDCEGESNFSFTDTSGTTVSYVLAGASPNRYIQRTANGVSDTLTDPSIDITALKFYVTGSKKTPSDYRQARVTIIVSGAISYGPGKTQPFAVETGATMRGTDI